MSFTFSVHNVSNLSYKDIVNELGINNLKLTEDSSRQHGNGWPEGYAYIYIDQISVRPIETSFSNGTFSARIFSNSSPEDYELAIKLIAQVAQNNNSTIEPEDNEVMDVGRFLECYNSEWIKEHCTTLLNMLLSIYKKEKGTCSLSGTVRELKAGPRFFEQLLAEPNNIFNEFYRRFKLLNYLENQDVYMATGIRLRNKEGDKEVVTSVYAPDVPTVISDSYDSVTLRTQDDENCIVSIEQLADALGEKAVWISENILFAPAIVDEDWNDLIESLKPVAAADAFEFAKPVGEDDVEKSSGFKSRFSDDEWKDILYSPIVVFALVAGADGSIDKKEVVSFQKELIKGIAGSSEMMKHVTIEVVQNMESLTMDVLEGKINPKSVIENIANAIDQKLSEEDAMHFKLSLLQIGKAIAQSSGGVLGMFGSKISKEERTALAALSLLLKVGKLH